MREERGRTGSCVYARSAPASVSLDRRSVTEKPDGESGGVFNQKWDVGPGESASFPTRWMSADGRTLPLVFSGDDHFAVRKATLTVPGNE